jgi:hypothetical protein
MIELVRGRWIKQLPQLIYSSPSKRTSQQQPGIDPGIFNPDRTQSRRYRLNKGRNGIGKHGLNEIHVILNLIQNLVRCELSDQSSSSCSCHLS